MQTFDPRYSMSSRPRKQRFPRLERKRAATLTRSDSFSELSDSDGCSNIPKSFGVSPTSHFSSIHRVIKSDRDTSLLTRSDKRARDEHNEQERNRRRELSVIYELIRCCLLNEDLRHLGPGNIPKSVDKLSCPQVLQIAYHIVCEEQHHLQLLERTEDMIKTLEDESARIGLPPIPRPTIPSFMETSKKIIHAVDDILKQDRVSRLESGAYEKTSADRAAMGNYELSLLKPKSRTSGVASPSYLNPSGPPHGFYRNARSGVSTPVTRLRSTNNQVFTPAFNNGTRMNSRIISNGGETPSRTQHFSSAASFDPPYNTNSFNADNYRSRIIPSPRDNISH